MKIYEVGDFLYFKNGESDCGHVIKRFSINPGGPLTYYDVRNSYGDIETIHLSQVTVAFEGKLDEPAKPVVSIREEVLDEAKRIVMKDRNTNYGSPEDNFRDIAEMWTTYSGQKFNAHDVAAMMIMVKLSRIKTSPSVQDHWVDIAGYSACGAQAHSVTMQAEAIQ